MSAKPSTPGPGPGPGRNGKRSFLDTLDDAPTAHLEKRSRNHRQTLELKEQLAALPQATLIQILMKSVSHGTGGGGGSLAWLCHQAAEAVAARAAA